MIAEVAIKAKILRQKLRRNPSAVKEVIKSLESLEADMFVLMIEFEEAIAK